MSKRAPLSLFAGFGVELEYMLVDAATLSVRPIADELLATLAGGPASDYEDGETSLSNELVAHVIELKTSGPAPSLHGLEDKFQATINKVNGILAASGARLMPGAAHPWMDPHAETRLWPGDSGEVYRAFDRIFNCQGHGWSNLQSVHLNLPFANDEEFGRLHAAIRLLLPILPALAASSPIIDGRVQPTLDSRLTYYRNNCARIPSVTGRVIPEPVFTQADYDREIFQPLYRDIAPHDPDRILQEEWLNARGAIARFTRNAIEIRVLDIQECPQADLAIVRLVVAVLKALIAERWCSLDEKMKWPVAPLDIQLSETIEKADQAEISPEYLRMFGKTSSVAITAQELWRRIYDGLRATGDLGDEPAIEAILTRGTLARRLVQALGPEPNPARARLAEVYGALCDCLAQGRMYLP